MIIHKSSEKWIEHEELASATSTKKTEISTMLVDLDVASQKNDDENDCKSEESEDEAISLTHSQRALLIKALNGALDDCDESIEDVLDETLGINGNKFAIKHVGGSSMELCASISRTITGSFLQSSSLGEEESREGHRKKKEEAMKNEIKDIIRQFQNSKNVASSTKEDAKKEHGDSKSEAMKKEIRELLRHIKKKPVPQMSTKKHGEEGSNDDKNDNKSEAMRKEVKELLRRLKKSRPKASEQSIKSQVVVGIKGVETILYGK